MQLESTKEIWDKFIKSYEGYDNVKFSKIQAYLMQFEILRMSEYENVECFFLSVYETVNIIKWVGEIIKEAINSLEGIDISSLKT
jgi:hypothetical protein